MTKKNLEHYLQLPYEIILRKEPCTDGSMCFLAYHPELSGCMSQGETQEEACQNLQEAKKLYIESLLENGQNVPLPHPQKSYSRWSGNNFMGNVAIPSSAPALEKSITIVADDDLAQDWDVVPAH